MNLAILVPVLGVLGACDTYSLFFEDGEEAGGYSTERRIFTLSEPLQNSVEYRERLTKRGSFPFTKETFKMLEWMLEGEDEPLAEPDMASCPLYQLMDAAECLLLPDEDRALVCRRLVKASLEGERVGEILDTVMEEGDAPAEFYSKYLLLFLREYAATCRVYVCVNGDTATIFTLNSCWPGNDKELCEVRNVKICASAFWRLVEIQPSGGSEKIRKLEVLVWILTHMGIEGLDLSGADDGWFIPDHVQSEDRKDRLAPFVKLDGLKTLNLKDFCLCPEDVQHLITLKSLKELDVSSNELDVDAVRVILGLEGLVKLQMHSCNLGQALSVLGGGGTGLVLRLASLIKEWAGQANFRPSGSLEELDVSHNRLNGSAIVAISKIKGLISLEMEDCEVGDTNLMPLRNLSNLRELNVGNCKLNLSHIQVVSRIVNLIKLNMSYCGLERPSLIPLRDLKNLKELDVSNNELDVDALRVLLGLEGLVKLVVNDCRIGWAPREELGTKVEKRPTDSVKESGVAPSGSLEELDIRNNRLSDKAILAISRVKSLIRLDMKGCRLEARLMPLGDLKKLKELDVSRTTGLLDSYGVWEISRMVNLTKLDMSYCGLNRTSVEHLRSLRHLKELNLCGNSLRMADIPKMSPLTVVQI